MGPVVSVILPVYNAVTSVKRCIDSILGQSHGALEIIAVDDGSTDGSAALLDTLAESDGRLRVLHVPNGGVSRARNLGLETAVGDYITFIDADDYLDENALSLLLGSARGQDLVQCAYLEVAEDGSVLKKSSNKAVAVHSSREALREFFKGNLHAACWGKLYRKELLAGLRFQSEYQVGEDDLFSWEVCRRIQSAVILPDECYFYVQNESSVMHRSFQEKHFQIFSIFEIQKADCQNDRELLRLCTVKELKTAHGCLYRIFSGNAMKEKIPFLRALLKKHFSVWLFSSAFSVKEKISFFLLVLTPRIYIRLKEKR